MELRQEIQENAIRIGKENSFCTIVLPMRVGKTYVGLNIAKDYEKVLVAYPNVKIKQSWVDDGVKFGVDTSKFTFSTFRSLEKLKLADYQLVILDEIHMLSEYQIDVVRSQPSSGRMIALTGTPAVYGMKKWFMDNRLPVKYRVNLEDTVGVINRDYEIIVHLVNPSTKKNIPISGGRHWSEADRIKFFEGRYITSKNFQKLLKVIQLIQNSETKLGLAKKLMREMERGIVFLETAEQCTDLGIPSYHSKDSASEANLKDFMEGRIDKISSIRQLSVGTTIQNLKEAILLHSYASNDKAAQRISRCLNYSPETDKAKLHIICLKDTMDVKWCKSGLEGFDQSKITWKEEGVC